MKKLFRNAEIVTFPLESFAVKVEQKRKGPWIYVYINNIEFVVAENTYNDNPKKIFVEFKYGKKPIILDVYLEEDMKYVGKTFTFQAKLENNWVYFEKV